MATVKRNYDEMTGDQIRAEAEANHIWLNAFACIRPTDAFLTDLGRMVLSKLNETDIRDGFTGTSPIVVIKVNMS